MDHELVEWLQAITDRAATEAHRARTEDCERADAEASVRAWERLQDAADGLHAFRARQTAYAAYLRENGVPAPTA